MEICTRRLEEIEGSDLGIFYLDMKGEAMRLNMTEEREGKGSCFPKVNQRCLVGCCKINMAELKVLSYLPACPCPAHPSQ